jgi:hypothetical protein
MDLRKPFIPLQHYVTNPDAAASLSPLAPLRLPPNTPPQIATQAWQVAAQNALQGAAGRGIDVDYTIVNGLLESLRFSSEYRTRGRLFAYQNITGEINLSVTDTETGWKRLDGPA